jgi:hypothetical protein
MRLLGVTWVIISMKILYGFALDAHHWGWYDALPDAGLGLGVTLLALVGLNVALAQRHNDDAIAAQATLILLLVGSAAGGLYGEFGVVLMIAFGTMVLHGMALLRGTGNLASLGIAASYLWVGVHALSDDWVVLGLHLVPLEDGLLTFLLMATITGMKRSHGNALFSARELVFFGPRGPRRGTPWFVGGLRRSRDGWGDLVSGREPRRRRICIGAGRLAVDRVFRLLPCGARRGLGFASGVGVVAAFVAYVGLDSSRDP